MRAWHRRSRRQPPVMSENETSWIISIKVHPSVQCSALTPCKGRNLCAPAEQFDDPPLHFCPQEQHTWHVFNLQTVCLMFSLQPPQKMVELPFRHEFELFSYSFICCKVFPFRFISACGLYFLFVFSLAALTRCFAVWHRASLTTPVLLVALKSTLQWHCIMIKAIQQHAHCGGRIKKFSVGFFFNKLLWTLMVACICMFFDVAVLQHSRFLFVLEMSASNLKYSSCCNILLTDLIENQLIWSE